MKLGNTPRSARLLLAALALCGILGSTRPAQADEPKPAVPKPTTLPRVFDGMAGFARASAYAVAGEATIFGVFWAFRSNHEANQAANLAAPLSGAHGIGACRRPLAVNVSACNNLVYRLSQRDELGDYSVGAFVLAGVATASIWLWRTPGASFWIMDWLRLTPTAGLKSGGMILQGAW